MKKKLFASTLLAMWLVLGLASAVLAQGPVPQHSDPHWQASYWNNATLSGTPVLTRQEGELNWNWGAGSPHASVNADGFSARWTRYLDLAAGVYRFTATTDDGMRVSVDGRTIIDRWFDQAARTYTSDVRLEAGHHLVVVEYYENGGAAVAQVSWALVSPTPEGWRGEFYANPSLSGSPALVRTDAAIDNHWGDGAPAPGLPSDNFSIRWTRTLRLDGGTYRFTTTTDDGVRLWVNGHLLIDHWRPQSARSFSGTIYLQGDVPVRMEYDEQGGEAVARLRWELAGATPPPSTDEVVVDNTDPGFTRGGTPSAWRTESTGYGGSLIWTWNNDQYRPDYNWARWTPNVEPGPYEVFVYIPESYGTTRAARYWIAHASGFTLRVVNQQENRGKWVSLGVYRFRSQDSDYVSLADITYEPYLSQTLAFDAVKWVPQSGASLTVEPASLPILKIDPANRADLANWLWPKLGTGQRD